MGGSRGGWKERERDEEREMDGLGTGNLMEGGMHGWRYGWCIG